MIELEEFESSVAVAAETRANVQDKPASSAMDAWFCLRTVPKHESVAAAQLRQEAGLEVFLPRIRFQRCTRLGPAWVTEALFQNYLFARFDLAVSLRRVQAARGVRGVVHFGDRWPTIPPSCIADLRAAMDGRELIEVKSSLQPGDLVQIADGAMHGLEAVVTRVMPSGQRAAVLLNFLGRQAMVELDRSRLIVAPADGPRRALIHGPGAPAVN
jgi:transcription antitermination factor NusG